MQVVSTLGSQAKSLGSREVVEGTIGDLNGDGVIDSADAEMAQNIYVSPDPPTDEQLERGDVDGDGTINATDALLIQRYADGEIDTFPAGTPETPGGGGNGDNGNGDNGNGDNGNGDNGNGPDYPDVAGSRSVTPGTIGDVTGDGTIGQADANAVIDHYVGNAQLPPNKQTRADVNGNGAVTPPDALLIARYANGERDSFPAGTPETPGGGNGDGGNGDGGNGGNGGGHKPFAQMTEDELISYIESRQGEVPFPPLKADEDSTAVCWLYVKRSDTIDEVPNRCWGSLAILQKYDKTRPDKNGSGGNGNGGSDNGNGSGDNGGGDNGNGNGDSSNGRGEDNFFAGGGGTSTTASTALLGLGAGAAAAYLFSK
jgi:hypothetical protein